MSMPVMGIRKVFMGVGQRLVAMAVRMRRVGNGALMCVLMVHVVNMLVRMVDCFVLVLVPMALGHVQPDAPSHQ